MTRSANEVMNLATKAARGAGAPPGQAADFGRAMVCHLVSGRDVADLQAALDALPTGPILDLPLAFARVISGGAQGIVPCEGCTALAHSYADALPFAQTTTGTTEGLSVTIDTRTPAPRNAPARVNLPDDFAAHMASLAARTFVPESDASRLSGAGAGLTDND